MAIEAYFPREPVGFSFEGIFHFAYRSLSYDSETSRPGFLPGISRRIRSPGCTRAIGPPEAAAILFAQHYAENLDRFDPESISNLCNYYSDAQVAEILAFVRAITLGSLTGNAVDAMLGRTVSPHQDRKTESS